MPLRLSDYYFKAPSIGLVTHRITEQLLSQKIRYGLLGRFILHWSSIVGPQWAPYTRPYKISLPPDKKGTATICVTAQKALAAEYAIPTLLADMNRFMGYEAFGRIIFRSYDSE
jgi:hypothetical protein